MHNQAKLTLVGAGPGDPELITLKGLSALRSAEVVLYDALVHPDLLQYAPEAEHIFVGKRKGCYAYQQDQINELIVSRAYSHGHVVRLKGGDPFVFGRGSEELEYASKYGIDVEVIPGISSCIAVPAVANIPVTKRGVSRSFWVITGTTREHKLCRDITLAARSSATVVVLMGMSKLPEIVQIFEKEGRSNLPVAIIQHGTLDNERIGVGTVNTILDVVEKEKLSNPAIIVLGEVVSSRSELNRVRYEAALKEFV
ncbi:uroporphyrinogen-III C-methyltransferase [Muriicola marianensis]|uniref:uroporphyrinogen-III C-methyltransferase n=1 Tax=Muriicola marianensis TaxID=1324801 RepID=A0ABQ1QX07_9FLAO|nr:uroporphyrinogen-III C-methyltransferase [Muriicola marianensis]GGD45542.1 uroporphyrinogen-III C-methyltransferase [Muriicola marianensis]